MNAERAGSLSPDQEAALREECWQEARRGLMGDLHQVFRTGIQGNTNEDIAAIAAGQQPGLFVVGDIDLGNGRTEPLTVSLLDGPHLILEGEANDAEAFLHTCIHNVLTSTPPRMVKLSLYDPGQPGRFPSQYSELIDSKAVRSIDPSEFDAVLDELIAHIKEVNEKVLGSKYRTLADMAMQTGVRPEPWRILAILGDGSRLNDHQRAQLARIMAGGSAAGVQVWAYGIGVERIDTPALQYVDFGENGQLRTPATEMLPIQISLRRPPGPEVTSRIYSAIAEKTTLARPAPPFSRYVPPPERRRLASAANGIKIVLGELPNGAPAIFELGDNCAHIIGEGVNGSGKTTVIRSMVMLAAADYPPSELEIDLHDFKGGAELGEFGPNAIDGTWLPNVRMMGLDITRDPEYGHSILRDLQAEKNRRQQLFESVGAANYKEYRAMGYELPRRLVVLDEGHELLAPTNPFAAANLKLLDDIGRQGRSAAIHIMLSSQGYKSIPTLLGNAGMLGQYQGRIAFAKSEFALSKDHPDLKDLELIDRTVIVSQNGGTTTQKVRFFNPDRITRAGLQRDLLRQQLVEAHGDTHPPAVVSGKAIPVLTDQEITTELAHVTHPFPVAFVGKRLDATARPLAIPLTPRAGSNIAVLGANTADIDDEHSTTPGTQARHEAHDILHSATVSVAAQRDPSTTNFAILVGDYRDMPAAERLVQQLVELGYESTLIADPHASPLLLKQQVEDLQQRRGQAPTGHFTIVTAYGADVIPGAVTPKSEVHANMNALLNDGPSQGMHVIGQWSNIARYRTALTAGAVFNRAAVNNTIAVGGVRGRDLSAFTSDISIGVDWGERPGRGLVLIDGQRNHRIIVPYGQPTE